MNWQKAAIEDLKHHEGRRQGLDSLKQRIKALEERRDALKSLDTDSTPVQGGGNCAEEKLINNIVERERLQHTYNADRILVQLVERGLKRLDAREREAIDVFFMSRPKNHANVLSEKWGVERSQVYRIKDEALYKFTISMYGITDY